MFFFMYFNVCNMCLKKKVKGKCAEKKDADDVPDVVPQRGLRRAQGARLEGDGGHGLGLPLGGEGVGHGVHGRHPPQPDPEAQPLPEPPDGTADTYRDANSKVFTFPPHNANIHLFIEEEGILYVQSDDSLPGWIK